MPDTSIYVIDDDEPTLRSLCYVLEILGYNVTGFGSATAFLEQWSEAAGGILISDIRMPDLDGISLARRLRDRGASLQIILVSGHTDAMIRREAIDAGAAVVLEKPFEIAVLIAELECLA
ncbi:response regulator [Sphingomonas sp.]|uniref:response regulator n=1 Tax=Sphingomonas sp. TaxID=28214 RepID=UPI003340F58C